MKDYFEELIKRRNTNSLKWDYCMEIFGKEDVLPMWVADMDFKSPNVVVEAIKRRAEHGVFGYTGVSNELNSALINWEKTRKDWSIDERWIVHTPGVVTSINIAVQSFTEVGDKILVQTPVYYPFYSSITGNKRTLVTNTLIYNDRKVEIDFDDLEEKLVYSKMMILCSPHNPIGRVWRKEELTRIIELCSKYDVFLISDEIHSDLVFKEFNHIPIQRISENIKNKSITLLSPTKTFNIAGLAESITIIPDDGLKKKFINTMNNSGANMLNIFGLTAAEAAYSSGQDWLDALIVYLEDNLDFLMSYFKDHIPNIKPIRPEATYLVWLDCRDLGIEKNKLKEFFIFSANVGLNDGISFGKEGYGFQRLNFACPRKILIEGLSRIKAAININDSKIF